MSHCEHAGWFPGNALLRISRPPWRQAASRERGFKELPVHVRVLRGVTGSA